MMAQSIQNAAEFIDGIKCLGRKRRVRGRNHDILNQGDISQVRKILQIVDAAQQGVGDRRTARTTTDLQTGGGPAQGDRPLTQADQFVA